MRRFASRLLYAVDEWLEGWGFAFLMALLFVACFIMPAVIGLAAIRW